MGETKGGAGVSDAAMSICSGLTVVLLAISLAMHARACPRHAHVRSYACPIDESSMASSFEPAGGK